ncbi:hypothetical protein P879_00453 [Paragonimus westermani]|uniref:Phosphatidic acid phosphatase type 2/haloperoxidase domain-containing protein n=1 Tax=Paragonimus westermani TaxID=34504 RepID=A0A8T0DYT8_9TREM|nr:hypothetical protein P879_00453 [Paragonimus westermani]
MNTLPSIRSVNTFQNTDVRRSSINNLRYPRATSLYLPTNEQDEESHTQLLPNTPYTGDRRAQTLGRPHQLTTGSRNLTNPLFDSVGSLDQTPWYRSYGQPVRTSPPRINLPMRPCDSSGFATARDIQSTIRIPVPRSPGRTSAYSAAGSRRFPDSSIRGSYERRAPRQTRRCPEGLGCLCCKSENSCSSDGWFYADRRVQTICVNLWSDWIPLHHRTFRCPALPPGYDESSLEINNPLLKQYLEQIRSPSITPAPTFGRPVEDSFRRKKTNPFGEPTIHDAFPQPEAWDADLGLMPPPNLNPMTYDPMLGLTTTRLYGPTYEREPSGWMRTREQWRKLNQASPYNYMSTGSILIGCLAIPLVTILCIEITASCLTCCQPYGDKSGNRFRSIRRVIGRLYRFSVTYLFGLLTVILLASILKTSVGRLRPNFIAICRPAPTVCPRWSALLQSTGLHQPDTAVSDQAYLTYLAQESARQGFYLVPKTTTISPNVREAKQDGGFLTDTDCTEKRVLKLKYARTSFPSLAAAMTMYSTIFICIMISPIINQVYITYTLRYLRRTCFCIPLSLLLGGCLANLFLGLGRVVHRENWLEDILVGWGLGVIIAAYVVSTALV